MIVRNVTRLLIAFCSLLLCAPLVWAQSANVETCKQFASQSDLNTFYQLLPAEVVAGSHLVVTEFAPINPNVPKTDAEASPDSAAGKIVHLVGGQSVYQTNYFVVCDESPVNEVQQFSSTSAVSEFLQTLANDEADNCRVWAQEFEPKPSKKSKLLRPGTLQLLYDYILFYRDNQLNANANGCGNSTGGSPTPTATASPFPTSTAPAPTSTVVVTASPTQAVGPSSTPISSITSTASPAPNPTPTLLPVASPTATERCVMAGGQACVPTATPTACVQLDGEPCIPVPTPTARCVMAGGQPCLPTPVFASPTPSPFERCVEAGGLPCPTPTPLP